MNIKFNRFHCLLVLGMTFLFLMTGGASAEQTNQHYVDVHMHLDGVPRKTGDAALRGDQRKERQRPNRMPRQKPSPESAMDSSRDYLPAASILIEAMNQAGVEKAIIMPPPQGPSQEGAYGFEDLLPAIRKYPDRLVLGAGGGYIEPDNCPDRPRQGHRTGPEEIPG